MSILKDISRISPKEMVVESSLHLKLSASIKKEGHTTSLGSIENLGSFFQVFSFFILLGTAFTTIYAVFLMFAPYPHENQTNAILDSLAFWFAAGVILKRESFFYSHTDKIIRSAKRHFQLLSYYPEDRADITASFDNNIIESLNKLKSTFSPDSKLSVWLFFGSFIFALGSVIIGGKPAFFIAPALLLMYFAIPLFSPMANTIAVLQQMHEDKLEWWTFSYKFFLSQEGEKAQFDAYPYLDDADNKE